MDLTLLEIATIRGIAAQIQSAAVKIQIEVNSDTDRELVKAFESLRQNYELLQTVVKEGLV